MELGLNITRLLIDNHGNSKYIKQMLQRACEIIEDGSFFCKYASIVHQQLCLKFPSCKGLILFEKWTIKIALKKNADKKMLDILFPQSLMRSYFHFLQLNCWTCSDAICKYRISVHGICLCIQIMNFEISALSIGRFNLPSFVNHKTVKWRAFMELSSHFEFLKLVSDDWLPLSTILFNGGHFITLSPETPLFYILFKYSQKSKKEKLEFELWKISVAASKNFCNLRKSSYIQLLINNSCAWNLSHLHSGPRICQFFNFRKDIEVKNEKVPLGNEQSPVGNLLSESESSTATLSLLQAVPPSPVLHRENLPRRSLIASAQHFMSTGSKVFSKTTGLSLNSSLAPLNRNGSKFIVNQSVQNTGNKIIGITAKEGARDHILQSAPMDEKGKNPSYYGNNGYTKRSMSSRSGLLCNFEESALNGRLNLVTSLNGFHLQIAASDEICTPHITLPVTTFFFDMPEDEAPSPYMGFCSLGNMRKGYRIPRKGILQAVLFNPQGTVVRLFVVRFDVSDMPPSSQTFLRQRTFFMPVGCTYDDVLRSWLKYLIHISLATDRRGRLYVHTDIKMLFSQKNELETLNFELGKDMIKYQLQSFTEMPRNPKYSPRK